MRICFNGNVMSAPRPIRIGLTKRELDIVPGNVEPKKSCRLTRSQKASPLGIKVKKVGLKTSKTLVSKRELEIQVGMVVQAPLKIEIEGDGESGVKLSSQGMIILANSAKPEEVSYIQTTLSALHTIQKNALQLVMEERFARVAIKVHPHMAFTKRSNA